MPDLLFDGLSWLGDQLKEHASQPVMYQRDGNDIAVQATIGRTLLQLDDGYGGVRMEWTDRDFLIVAADLILAGSPIVPKRGDRIRHTNGETVGVFEVMAPGKEPVWRPADPFGTMLRIHTKRIGTEPS